jgi:hypothetical protein
MVEDEMMQWEHHPETSSNFENWRSYYNGTVGQIIIRNDQFECWVYDENENYQKICTFPLDQLEEAKAVTLFLMRAGAT